jgi:hypothetical protein
MRYRLMASYLGASYQAAVGPSDRDVTLFAAPPPPEEHGFSPAPGGIWRKQVRLDDLGGLWESRPIGSYHGEPCLVLDDLGDRLHIVYLGMDERRAAQLGYWEVDHGVFEVVVPRYDVTDLAEERHEFPIALLLAALPAPPPRALGSAEPVPAGPGRGGPGGPAGPGGPGAPGTGQNGMGMTPQGPGRAIGAIGPGGGAPPVPVPGGALANGQGAGGGAAWNGPAGVPQRAMGQLPSGGRAPLPAPQLHAPHLPAPTSQPAAPAAVQQPVPGAYYSVAGAAQNGAGQQAGPGLPNGLSGRGGAQFPEMPQLHGGQQLPPGFPRASVPGAPGSQFAIAAPAPGAPGTRGAQAANGTAPLSAPTMQPPGRQLPAAQQQPAQQFPPPPPAAQQTAGPPPPAPMTQGTLGQGMLGQGTGPQAAMPQAPMPQPVSPQAPQAAQAQAPTAVAAWHGSPAAANGNGTWYFQPAADPQQGGAPGTVYAPGGLTPGGYARQDQPAAQVPPPNGYGGMQQFAQPAPVAGFQQAPAPPAPAAPHVQPGQQGMPQPPQPPQVVQPAQAPQPAQGPQFAAPPAPQAAQAPPAPPQAPPAAGPPAAPGMPGGFGAGGTFMPNAGLPAPQAPQAPWASMGVPAAAPGPAAAPPAVQAGPVTAPLPVPPPVAPQPMAAAPPVAPPAPAGAAPAESGATGPLTTLPPAPPVSQGTHSSMTAVGALSKLTGAVRGRRAARKPRLAMSAIFADLVDMADIPRSAYAVDEEVTGAMCLFKTDGGYEVFSCAEDARHEVRFFEEEEAAYFYLFGVLAAEALRNGRLSPRRG